MEDSVQSVRPLGAQRVLAAPVRSTESRSRRRVAQHGQHDQSGASARKGREGGPSEHGIGRSRGGLTTKVHLVVDALGLPLVFKITEGQRHDVSRPGSFCNERNRAACWPTRPTIRTYFARHWTFRAACPSSHLTAAEPASCRTTRSCTRPEPRSSAPSTC